MQLHARVNSGQIGFPDAVEANLLSDSHFHVLTVMISSKTAGEFNGQMISLFKQASKQIHVLT